MPASRLRCAFAGQYWLFNTFKKWKKCSSFPNFHFNEIKYMKSDLVIFWSKKPFLAVIMTFFFCHAAAAAFTLKDFVGGLLLSRPLSHCSWTTCFSASLSLARHTLLRGQKWGQLEELVFFPFQDRFQELRRQKTLVFAKSHKTLATTKIWLVNVDYYHSVDPSLS